MGFDIEKQMHPVTQGSLKDRLGGPKEETSTKHLNIARLQEMSLQITN